MYLVYSGLWRRSITETDTEYAAGSTVSIPIPSFPHSDSVLVMQYFARVLLVEVGALFQMRSRIDHLGHIGGFIGKLVVLLCGF